MSMMPSIVVFMRDKRKKDEIKERGEGGFFSFKTSDHFQQSICNT